MNAEKSNKYKVFDKLPFKIVEVDEKTPVLGPGRKWLQVGPKKYIIQDVYRKYGLDLRNFEARPDDVYLIGYPRSGTTLHCEMVWQIGNNLDYDGAGKDVLDYRFPHIDSFLFQNTNILMEASEKIDVPDDVKETVRKYNKLTVKDLAERKGRRFLKSHLPLSLMPPHIFEVGAKVIYCARNPKDVLVSLANVSKFFSKEGSTTVEEIFEYQRKGLAWNCPYFEHVKEAWNRRNDENFLFLFYEDTIKDTRQSLKKIAAFLGKKLSNTQIESLEEYLNIENFKRNKSVNCDHLVKLGLANGDGQFIAKGKSGSWREVFDDKLEKEVNEWIEENLKETDLRFPEV